MNYPLIGEHITDWLHDYVAKANMDGFVVGISGGVDSAVTSSLCALTGKKVILVSMPIHQAENELNRANLHIEELSQKFTNVEHLTADLSNSFETIKRDLPDDSSSNSLAMANTRARLRMLTLYAIAQNNNCLVAGTGNKIEDFGIGFYTKYGDGGVDLSPIADLTKTQVWALAKELAVNSEIINAKPTDGLWGDDRNDEDQIGASYPELEWAMNYSGDDANLNDRQSEVLKIYRRLNKLNRHKMEPIPVCEIPSNLL